MFELVSTDFAALSIFVLRFFHFKSFFLKADWILTLLSASGTVKCEILLEWPAKYVKTRDSTRLHVRTSSIIAHISEIVRSTIVLNNIGVTH